MNFNSVNLRNIILLKAHYKVEDGSSLKLTNHLEMKLHTPGRVMDYSQGRRRAVTTWEGEVSVIFGAVIGGCKGILR